MTGFRRCGKQYASKEAAERSHSASISRFLPLARSSTYKLPSCDPTYTRAPATTGELSILPSVRKFQTSLPVVRFSA